MTTAEELRLALAENERLKAALETETMRLAGCGVAAMCNTEKSIREQGITPDSPYYSASYGDVCRIVRSEMALRAALESLQKKYDELEGRRWRYPTLESVENPPNHDPVYLVGVKHGFNAARETIEQPTTKEKP